MPPGIVSSYSSPSLNLLIAVLKRVAMVTIHSSSFLFISKEGLDEHIIFLGIYGTPEHKQNFAKCKKYKRKLT